MVSRLSKQGVLPKTILDVGANVGQFTVASAKIFPTVIIHCFEPSPESGIELKKNISKLKNITVYPIALGDKIGEEIFFINTYSPSSSMLPLTQEHKTIFPAACEKETIMVKVSTLDEIFRGFRFKPPVLLKLDVQGYEARILAGAINTLKKIQYIIVETSFRPMYRGELLFRDILKILEDQNFQFIRPVDVAIAQNSGEIIQMDALFMRC
jgi:FkbM family methyltransferase